MAVTPWSVRNATDENRRKFQARDAIRSCRTALAVVVACAPSFGSAQVVTTDLALEARYTGFDYVNVSPLGPPPPTSTGGSITPTRVQVLNLVARNLGSVAAAGVVVTFQTSGQVSPHLSATPDSGCLFDAAAPPFSGLRWLTGPLTAGAEVTCNVTLRCQASCPYALAWTGGSISSPSVTDPRSQNNVGGTVMFTAPEDFVRDMALSISSPAGILAPGSVTTVDFTMTNRGPGPESPPNFTQIAYSERYLVGPGSTEYFELAEIGDPDCSYRVTDVGSINFTRSSEIVFGPLPPGVSRTCTMGLFIFPNAVGSRSLAFYNWAEGPGVFDADLSNNTAYLRLQFPPAPIPADDPWWLAVLALLVAGCGWASLVRMRVTARA